MISRRGFLKTSLAIAPYAVIPGLPSIKDLQKPQLNDVKYEIGDFVVEPKFDKIKDFGDDGLAQV
jgi:hypothetical protein